MRNSRGDRAKRWEKLTKPANHYNELIVREFYANAYPLKQKSK